MSLVLIVIVCFLVVGVTLLLWRVRWLLARACSQSTPHQLLFTAFHLSKFFARLLFLSGTPAYMNP